MRRFALNPCDYLHYAIQDEMRSRGLAANIPFMMIELDGCPAPAETEAAVHRTIDAHPVLRSRAGVSWMTGKPYWHTVASLDRPAFEYVDVSGASDPAGAADRLCQERFDSVWDLRRSPQVRVELYRCSRVRSVLCIRWPHAVMDAKGGQWFLHEMDRLARDPVSRLPDALGPADTVIDPLAGKSWLKRAGLFRRGMRESPHYRGVTIEGLADGPIEGGRLRYTHRSWSGGAYDRLLDRVDALCPDGPGRLSGYLAACVMRALHTIFLQRSIETEAYLLTLPMRLRDMPEARPLTGNYIATATLCGRRVVVEDKRRLLEELADQIAAFRSPGSDLCNWATLWMLGHSRAWQCRKLVSRYFRRSSYACGFSVFGEIDPPLCNFLGSPIRSFWACNSMFVPPGWNLTFSRFAGSLNMALAWLEGYYTAETAGQFVGLIEQEMSGEKVVVNHDLVEA